MLMMATVFLQRYAFILGTLAFLQPADCSRTEMELLTVKCDVEHRYAVTHVTAAVTNWRNTSQEIPLRMTLPKNAYVTSLVMEVGGRNYTTIVTEKRRHRRKGPMPDRLDGSKNRKRDENTQKFKASAKARGLQKVIFYLSYEELLHRTRGRYIHTLYLGAAQKVRVVDVTVRVLESEPLKDFRIAQIPWLSSSLTRSTSSSQEEHQVRQEIRGPGDVMVFFKRENVTFGDNVNDDNDDAIDDEDDGVLSVMYDIDRRTDGGEIQVLGQFFVHYFSPEGLPKLPTHTVFVLDVSGSMHDNGKLQQLKMAMRAILTDLQSEDSYEILVFSTRVTSLGVFQAQDADIERSLSKIQRLQALGGTNFNDALLKALGEINNFNLTTGAKQVVFLTDGRPNLGEKKPNQLRRNIREANIHHHPIFSLGFGQDADMRLLRQVSSDNRGFTRQIDEDLRPAEQLKGFYDEISAPLMTDVDVIYLEDEVDANTVVRHGQSTFYAGDEMVLAGQLMEGVTQVQPIITGQGSSGPLQFRVSRISTTDPPPERDNYVERLWAYLTVQDLLEMQTVVEDNNLRAEMNARALEIALRFHFVTELTSLDLEEPNGTHNGDTHPYKSASRHQKSNTGLKHFPEELTLLSEAEFAKTLPAPLTTRLNMANNDRFSFGDNDPHFVVQVSGIEMPLCFDIHGQHGQVLSLVRDHKSGIMVTGRVTSAVDRPEATYFTEVFITMGNVNFTITPHNITMSPIDDPDVNSEAARVLRSVWPFKKMYRGGGGRGEKARSHSNRKFLRHKRSQEIPKPSCGGQITRHQNEADSRIFSQIKSSRRVTLQGSNAQQSRLFGGRVLENNILGHHDKRHFKMRPNFTNNKRIIQNNSDAHRWVQSYQSKRMESDYHNPRKLITESENMHKYSKRSTSQYPRATTKAMSYNNSDLNMQYNKSFYSSGIVQFLIHNQRSLPKNSRTGSQATLIEVKREHKKKRLRRWSKFRKRGKTRHKRNAPLSRFNHFLHQKGRLHASHTQQRVDRESTTKMPLAESHPHRIRHYSHANASGHHAIPHSGHMFIFRDYETRNHSHNLRNEKSPDNLHETRHTHQQGLPRTAHMTTTDIGTQSQIVRPSPPQTVQQHNRLSKETHNLQRTSDDLVHPQSTTESQINESEENSQVTRHHTKINNPFLQLLDTIYQAHTRRSDSHPQEYMQSLNTGTLAQVTNNQTKWTSINSHNQSPSRSSHPPYQGVEVIRSFGNDQYSSVTGKHMHQSLDTSSMTSNSPPHPKDSTSLSDSRAETQESQETENDDLSEEDLIDMTDGELETSQLEQGDKTLSKESNEHRPNIKERYSTQHDEPQTGLEDEECHLKKTKKMFTWRRAAGRRYGDVIVALRNRKKLDLLMGDVDAHFVITRSKTKYGQDFLGFYVEEHKILSPNTTGIIGQFAYKTVGTMDSSEANGQTTGGMKLAVLQPHPNRQYRVSEVNGIVSRRRSMLHKSHVRCLLIPHQGRGLVAGAPTDYLLPCLCC